MISEDFIAELKDNLDIASVIGSYVQLRRKGSNLMGLCPFHNEKTPSFSVSPERGFFHCFGCGAGGDVITFIRRIENIDYVEAVRLLCDRAGMTMPEDDEAASQTARLRQRIFELNRAAARFFHAALHEPHGAEGLRYLRGRGLTDAVITRFGLGFAPDGWDVLQKHLHGLGFTDYELDAARVTTQTRKGGRIDMFRNRVVFPIIDTRGNVIAFGARAMGDEQPKYLNTADTPVFKKSRNLFALNFAKNAAGQPLILVEGYMDVIAIHAAGFQNAVATLGTALTAEQARILANYTKEIILSYDADEAGQKATQRAYSILDEVGLRVRVLKIEGAKDPDEYIRKFGAVRFGNLLNASAGAIEYQLSRLRMGRNMEASEDRLAYLKDAARLLAALQSGLERDLYAGRLAEECGTSKAAVLEAVEGLRRQVARTKRREEERILIAPPRQRESTVNPERRCHEKEARAEDGLLRLLYRHPNLLDNPARRLSADDFVTSFNRRLYEFMTQKLRTQSALDPTAFSAAFTNEEMGEIVALLFPSEDITYAVEDADKLIAVLREAKEVKTDTELVSMDPQEIQKYITRKAPQP